MALGLVLGAIGVAQTVGGLFEASAKRSLDSIDWMDPDTPVNAAQVQAAIEDFKRADAWWPNPGNPYGIGFAETRLAERTGDKSNQRAALDDAVRELRESIARAPANGTGWAWLAYALFQENGPTPDVVDAFSTSLEFARYEPSLLALRCQLGLTIYPLLDTDRKADLAQQIRWLGQSSPNDLIRIARSTRQLNIVIQALLAGDNKVALHFLVMLRYIK